MTEPSVDIPLGLRTALEAGSCTLFLGACVGAHLLDDRGNEAPDAARLAIDLAAAFSIEVGENPALAMVAQVVELRNGRQELETYLTARLERLEPDTVFRWICTTRWRAIFALQPDRFDDHSAPIDRFVQ